MRKTLKRLIVLPALIFCLPMFLSGEILDVITGMSDSENLVDGDLSTVAQGSEGDNVIVLQFGQLIYVDNLSLVFAKEYEISRIEIFVSEDFFNWESVSKEKNVELESLSQDFSELTAMYMKIEIESDEPFLLSEVACDEGIAPENTIGDMVVTELTETSATIQWETEIPTMDYFFYIKKYNGERETLLEMMYSTEHEVRLDGLLKGCEYIYQIVSESPDGTRLMSEEQSFTTEGVPYPEFWEVIAENITSFSASFAYKSNVPTRYEMFMGDSIDSLKSVEEGDNYSDEQDIDLYGLQPETEYYYQLYITDKERNVLMTEPFSFYTPAFNAALGKTVWGTFDYAYPEVENFGYGTTTVERATDGILNYWEGMAVSYQADNADQYVVIDLGEPTTFKKVNVYWWGLGYSKDYRIDLSDDGVNWETMEDGLDADDGEEMRSGMGDLLVYHSIDLKKTARFVRVYIEAGNERGTKIERHGIRDRLYLCEVAVIEDL